ncbi:MULTISPECIES: hypothetical protein [unclassified Paenibacillus]|uniref:hypothetical protein n=1 Tax=unclassified Paenibacillus TaxID=185978 RepID=UPI001C0F7362|nr:MULTISPECIES: hypothetical protein [unclassified Paenibacillus]MBU5443047.1 hypothetical protein [Paenibacillus sp. MSJ-34]CAH0118580.1 hypothetical protein PAE9249_01069 [Paenibacillus sp. CECT 9249]
MVNRYRITAYIFIAFALIGLVVSILEQPGQFIIPLLVIGVVFVLYKFPPQRFRSMRPGARGGYRRVEANRVRPEKPKRKRAPFRVIDGSKKGPDDDDYPKYH